MLHAQLFNVNTTCHNIPLGGSGSSVTPAVPRPLGSTFRGLVQTIFGKISVIVTLGGGGGYDTKKILLFASVGFLYNGTCRALASCSGRPAVQYVYSDYTFRSSLTKTLLTSQ